MPSEKTVLVVDDEPIIRSFLRLVLEDEGYTVETATDGCDALTKARNGSPDAILLDVLMPVLDGLGFIQEWRDYPAWASVPVLLMSVEDTPVQAETFGACGMLLKPFDLDVLLRRLGALLA